MTTHHTTESVERLAQLLSGCHPAGELSRIAVALRDLAAERDALHARLGGGVSAIAEERKRQVEVEGWTPRHDDQYESFELPLAGASYALQATLLDGGMGASAVTEPPSCWPWHRGWWKPKDRRRNLARAGALIAAEIDRLDRAFLNGGGNG